MILEEPMSNEERKTVSIIVVDEPPVKGQSGVENRRRKQKLQEEAKKQLENFKPKSNRFNIKINYYGRSGSDLTNIEGGIHDALSGIVYNDDRQVQSANIEGHLVWNDQAWYKIDIEFRKPGLPIEDGELSRQQKISKQ